MGVNVYISCHVHVKAARSGRAALELLAVRKGWGYTNNEHIHAHLQKRTALSTLTVLQTLSCNFFAMHKKINRLIHVIQFPNFNQRL